MVDRIIQSSFNVGEIAPSLYARTDLAKYHSAAATVRNFFVDYRGGVSTRAGTQFIMRAYKSGSPVRLIPFQASPKVNYVLEFGDFYIRFYNNRQPILETAFVITAYSAGVATIPGHNYVAGDWFYHSTDGGYYLVTAVTSTTVTLTNLDGSAPTRFTGLGTAARVYTIVSPYAAADLALIKFAQNVLSLIICHPLYPPQVVTLITFNNWSIVPLNFGSSAGIPQNLNINTSLGTGPASYGYVVSAVDNLNQESGASSPVVLNARTDLRSTAGTNRVSWDPVPGVVSYNVYKADVNYYGVTAAGSPYGFIGNTLATNFADSNTAPNFALTPPIFQNPFTGAGVNSITINSSGSYNSVPSVSIGGTPAQPGAAQAFLGCNVQTVSQGSGYVVGERVSYGYGIVQTVTSVNGSGGILTTAVNPSTSSDCGSFGGVPGTAVPTTPLPQTSTTGVGTGSSITGCTFFINQVQVTTPGFGYTGTPPVAATAPSSGTTSLKAVLGASSDGYPGVPQFFQQRLVFGGSTRAPGGFNMSIPGSYYNFNISFPSQSDDAISAKLVSGQLNTIKSMIGTSAGLIILTDKALWLINGGTAGTPVSPSQVSATIQTYNGASDLPPIVVNYDVLYVQTKGSIVRDASYNLYANVYTGSDVSLLSSHLFYGHTLQEWAFAEEPYKLIWAVREDGVMLSLTFLKEQEFIGWARSDTLGGAFRSVAVVSEPTNTGSVDAVYTVVDRVINGQLVKYIERIADRDFTTAADAWCVDCAIRYVGTPISSLSGAMHLAGLTVTGLADGVPITPFVMPANGAFTLPTPASKIIVGLAITAQLKTLAIDSGDPTVQGKQKKIPDSVLRVNLTLGLKIGTDFGAPLVWMKDLQLGNVGSYSNTRVTDLVTSDVRTFLDPNWNAFGQYAIQQDMPYPATILGVMPGLTIGDK